MAGQGNRRGSRWGITQTRAPTARAGATGPTSGLGWQRFVYSSARNILYGKEREESGTVSLFDAVSVIIYEVLGKNLILKLWDLQMTVCAPFCPELPHRCFLARGEVVR